MGDDLFFVFSGELIASAWNKPRYIIIMKILNTLKKHLAKFGDDNCKTNWG